VVIPSEGGVEEGSGTMDRLVDTRRRDGGVEPDVVREVVVEGVRRDECAVALRGRGRSIAAVGGVGLGQRLASSVQEVPVRLVAVSIAPEE